jgi:hypothetical protein
LADCLLLAIQYVCHVLNHLASSTLGWTPPLQALTGQNKDTSVLLVCAFWEPVYYNPHNDGFSSNPNEELGHWVGDSLTFKILRPANKVIYWSVICSALDPSSRHKHLAPPGVESNHADYKEFMPKCTFRGHDALEIQTQWFGIFY